MTTRVNLTLRDRASPVIEQLIFFHDHALIIILIIITTVFYTVIRIVQNKQTRRFILEGQIFQSVRCDMGVRMPTNQMHTLCFNYSNFLIFVGWRERETIKMQLIWCLLSNFYLIMFRALLCPSSGEQECALFSWWWS